MGWTQHTSQHASAFRTVHPVGLHKLLVFFVDTEGAPSKLLDVLIEIPAEILIKDCEQQVKFLVYSFLEKMKKQRHTMYSLSSPKFHTKWVSTLAIDPPVIS